jgi:hypothetical protein
MTFEASVLPIGHFWHLETDYLDLLKQSPALPSTAEAATPLLTQLAELWDFFRRGHFYSDNEEIEDSEWLGNRKTALFIQKRPFKS